MGGRSTHVERGMAISTQPARALIVMSKLLRHTLQHKVLGQAVNSNAKQIWRTLSIGCKKKKKKPFIENNLITVRGNAKGGKLVYMISLERKFYLQVLDLPLSY